MATREKTALIQLRCTPAQKQIIVWAAEQAEVSITDFMLTASLQRAYSTLDLTEKRRELVKMAAAAEGISEKELKDQAILELAMKILHNDS